MVRHLRLLPLGQYPRRDDDGLMCPFVVATLPSLPMMQRCVMVHQHPCSESTPWNEARDLLRSDVGPNKGADVPASWPREVSYCDCEPSGPKSGAESSSDFGAVVHVWWVVLRFHSYNCRARHSG